MFFLGQCQAQDTLLVSQLKDTSVKRNGKFIVVQPNEVYITGQKIINPCIWYQVGYLKDSKQDSIWESYKIGKSIDTLFYRAIWKNDTLLTSTEYYSNGKPKLMRNFTDGRLIEEIRYFTKDGKKSIQVFYMTNKRNDCCWGTDEIKIGYYRNGQIKFIGRSQSRQTKVHTSINIGDWYYYSDKGEIYKIEHYKKGEKDDEPEVEEFKIKGKYFEWTQDNATY